MILGLFIAVGAARAETGKPPDPDAAARGKTVYQAYCQSCHGERGVGETIRPPFVQQPGQILAPALDDSMHAWHHSDEDLVRFILQGSPRTKRMAGFRGILSEKQARDVVAYIKSLWASWAIACQGPKHMACMRRR